MATVSAGKATKKAKQDATAKRRSVVKTVFGTMTLAGSVDESVSRQMLDVFVQHPSVKSHEIELDTAFLYEEGRTEELLGKIMTDEERKTIFVATKGSRTASGAKLFPRASKLLFH